MKITFYSHANKTRINNEKFSLSLVFKVRVFQTRKWSIELFGCGRATKHLLHFEKKRLFSFQFSTFFPVWKTGLQILRLFFQNSRLGTNPDLRKATYRKPLTVLTWKTFLTISIFSTFVAICCFNLKEREV